MKALSCLRGMHFQTIFMLYPRSPTPILLLWLSSSLSSEFIASASLLNRVTARARLAEGWPMEPQLNSGEGQNSSEVSFCARATVVCHWHKVLPLQGTHPAVVCAQCPALPHISHVGLMLTSVPLYLTWVLYLQKCKMFYESSMGHLPRKYIGPLKAVQTMLTSHITRWLAAAFLSERSFGAWTIFRSILSDVSPVQKKALPFM